MSPVRVLVCDDVRDVRFMLRMGLGRDNTFDVVGEACNGLEAIERAQQLQPDVILLDLSMPVLDGLSALPRLREVAPDSKVIVLSGLERKEIGSAALGAGAVDFIEKGAHLDEIVRRVKGALSPGGRLPAGPARRPAGRLRQVEGVAPQDHRTLVPRRSLRAMLGVVPDAAVAVDDDGAIVAANERASYLFGYPPDELIGLQVESLMAQEVGTGPGRLRPRLQAGPTGGALSEDLPLRALRADRSEFPAEVRLSPIECEQGAVLVAAFRDTSERIRANRAQARLAAIVESSEDAIFSVDAGRITSWNHGAERLYGYRADEVLDRPVASLGMLGGPTDFGELEQRVLAGVTVLRHEVEGLTKNGHRPSLWLSVSPLRDGSGAVAGMSIIARDITEQRGAARALEDAYDRELDTGRQLRQLDLVKNTFLRALSHDLRSPLAVMVGMADLVLQRDRHMEPRDREALELVVCAGERLGRVMSDLLDVDRLSRGSLEALREETDVVGVVAQALDNLERELCGHPVRVDAPSHLVATVDPAQTERIIENLLANAVRHTPPGTNITVSVEAAQDGAAVLLGVCDEGPGIPDERKDRIFELFATWDASGQGTGIGLHLVSQLAQLHNGRAWVEETPGGGSTFRVLLTDSP